MNKFITQLHKETKKWTKQKLISQKQAEIILKTYPEPIEDLLFIKIASIVSIVFILVWTLLFLGGSWSTISATIKIIIIILLLWVLWSISFLLLKHKQLHKWFVWLLVSVIGLGISLILINSVLNIQLPYFIIASLWFLCIIPFVQKFKFKYFYIIAIIVLHIAIFLWLLYFFPQSVIPLSLLTFITLWLIISNFAKIARAKTKYSEFKKHLIFYDQRYIIWVIEVLIFYFLLSNQKIFTYITNGIDNYYNFYQGELRPLLIFSIIPLLSSIAIIIIYYYRRKRILDNKIDNKNYKKEKWNKKQIDFKKQIKNIIKNELWFIIHNIIFFITTSALLYSNISFTTTAYIIFNICFLWIVLYLVYEGILIKIPKITNIAMLTLFLYLVFKYIQAFQWKMETPVLIILWWSIFLWIWYIFEKTRKHYHKKIAWTIKDKVDYNF